MVFSGVALLGVVKLFMMLGACIEKRKKDSMSKYKTNESDELYAKEKEDQVENSIRRKDPTPTTSLLPHQNQYSS